MPSSRNATMATVASLCASVAVLAAVVTIAAGNDHGGSTLPDQPSITVLTTTSAPAPQDDAALSCERMPDVAEQWRALATLAGESTDPAADVDRAALESLIQWFAFVSDGLPPAATPHIDDVVTPLVQLRGAILTGTTPTIDFGRGRDALDAILAACR